MATGPDAPNLEVKLRERAAWHILVHVTQQVELLFVSQESPVHSLIDVVVGVYSEKDGWWVFFQR
jgi:hypothetical protein